MIGGLLNFFASARVREREGISGEMRARARVTEGEEGPD